MPRTATIRAACVAVLLIVSAEPAGAAVMPYTQIDQTRNISVNVSARATTGGSPEVSDGATESSNATGTFFRSMAYEVTAREEPPGLSSATADGSARQDVVFGETAIFGTISARAHVSHRGGIASATANSQFNTHFTVAQDTPFTLSGQISMSSSGLGTVGRFIEQFGFGGVGPEPGQTETFAAIGVAGGNGGDTYPLQASGVLHPGWTYVLSSQLFGEKSTEGFVGVDKTAEGRADFVITVPEPCGLAAACFAVPALLARRRRRP